MVIHFLCHPETIKSNRTQRQIMVIHFLCHPETIKSVGMQRQIMVIRFLRHLETIKSDGTQRQIMVICPFFEDVNVFRLRLLQSPFAFQRQASPLACKDKLWSFASFFLPEIIMSVGMWRPSWSSVLFDVFKTIAIFFAFQRQGRLLACRDNQCLPLFIFSKTILVFHRDFKCLPYFARLQGLVLIYHMPLMLFLLTGFAD